MLKLEELKVSSFVTEQKLKDLRGGETNTCSMKVCTERTAFYACPW